MKSMIKGARRAWRAIFVVALLSQVASTHNTYAQSFISDPIAPEQEIFFTLSTGQSDDDTAIRFRNLSPASGEIQAERVFGPTLGQGQTVAEGFVLLDNYLRIATDIPQGQKRMLVRMEVDLREVRARRIRADSLRIMRFDENTRHWGRAIRAIRDGRARQNARFIRGRAQFFLGRYGIDPIRRTVWATVDVTSSYAIGGIPVPEPMALMCFSSGAGLLLLSRRRSAV